MKLRYIGTKKNVKLIINDKEVNIPIDNLIDVDTKDITSYTSTGQFEIYELQDLSANDEKTQETFVDYLEEDDNDGC